MANKPKVLVPQAQNPIALIGELVKALNLYSNLGVGNHFHMNKNSNARDASKKFWMQKNSIFIAILFVNIFLWLVFVFFVSRICIT